jgi:hypothetical protein
LRDNPAATIMGRRDAGILIPIVAAFSSRSTRYTGHQNAIAAAQSAFNAAREQATRDWQDRLGAAKAKFDAVKSHAELADETAVIRRELDAVRGPDTEPARRQLGRDVEAADAALNDVLAGNCTRHLQRQGPRPALRISANNLSPVTGV